MKVLLQQFADCLHVFINGKFDDSHQRPVRTSLDKNKLAEVLVLGQEHAVLLEGQRKKVFVAGGWVNGQRRHHVMSLGDKKVGERAR